MNDIFNGTRALVTGASSGLGDQFARQLAAQGADLIITARSQDKLDALAQGLMGKHDIDVQVIAQDLAKPGGALELCQKVDALNLPVDHLINNAGYGSSSRFYECDLENETRMVRLNSEAVITLARHFLPGMVQRKTGGVLSVASVAGMPPMPYLATYGATKAFVVSWTAGVAEELRGTGVHVSALCPGPVPTGFQETAGVGIDGADKLLVLSAEETVRRGLKAYGKNKTIFIPGAMNKAGMWGVKFTPRALAAKVVGMAMKDSMKS